MLFNKIKGITIVFSICAIFILCASQLKYFSIYDDASNNEVRFIVDAGHGIPDGGAVAPDHTTEQQLNLEISKVLSKQLTDRKVSHIMTRSDENSIFTEGETIHEKKVSDIRNRIALGEKYPEATYVSVHMNMFPNQSVSGVQVFYKKEDPASRDLANELQAMLNEQLQPKTPKTAKTISDNIYLFANTSNSAILIECGFLSNPDDLSKLKNKQYQNELATIIADCIAK